MRPERAIDRPVIAGKRHVKHRRHDRRAIAHNHARLALADPLDDPGPGEARIVRLGAADYGRSMRDAVERFEEEAAAGALADMDALVARLDGEAVLDLVVPAGSDDAAFDALEARFPTRGMAEAESEMNRLSSGTSRLVVCFARRGDMERTQGLLSSVKPVTLEPDGRVPGPGEWGDPRARRRRWTGGQLRRELRSDSAGFSSPQRSRFESVRPLRCCSRTIPEACDSDWKAMSQPRASAWNACTFPAR